MKKYIIICILSFISSLSYAGVESKRESIEELLILMKGDSIMDSMYSQYDQMMQAAIQKLGVKPSEQEVLDKFRSRMVALFKSQFNWEKLKVPIIEIYLKYYTEKEIQDMITFYKSDSGRSMIEKMPKVMSESVLLLHQMMQGFSPKFDALFQEFKEELDRARKSQ